MPARPLDRASRPRLDALAAPLVYALASFLTFGLPIVSHPRSTIVGDATDPGLSVWSFAWWPHAIRHGLNPFYPHLVWAPGGTNLAWAGSIPAISLLFSPLTALAGPEVSYNVASVLAPALAAWTAFLLCRYLTQRFWPSLAGGYLFGFSSYVLGQQQGHFTLTGVFVLPLEALVVLRYLDGRLARRRLVVYLALLIAFEVATSTEIAFTMTLALAVALGLSYLLVPERRPRLSTLPVPLVASYALAAVLVSPFLYYALSGFESSAINNINGFPGDALNLVVPTGLVALSGSWANSIAVHFRGNTSEEDLYLGVPVLAIALLSLVRGPRSHAARFLGAALAISIVASLGSGLYVKGHRVSAAPWWLLHRLPFFDNVITPRLAVYSALVAAVIVARWGASDRAGSVLRCGLVGIAVLTQLPNAFTRTPWKVELNVPQFFTASGSSRCLGPNDNLLVLPYFSYALLWQANNGFRYGLAAPYLMSEAPPRLRDNPLIADLTQAIPPRGGGRAIVRTARALGATAIVVPDGQQPWRGLLSGVIRPVESGGVAVYRLPGARRSGCGGG